MHPYRTSPRLAVREQPHGEELVLYLLFMAIGAIPVLIALVDATEFGVEATVGLLMMCAAAIGVIADRRRRRSGQPRADSGDGSRSR